MSNESRNVDIAGWDKPRPRIKPLPGQLVFDFESAAAPFVSSGGQAMLFDSGNDLPGIEDEVKHGQQLLFTTDD